MVGLIDYNVVMDEFMSIYDWTIFFIKDFIFSIIDKIKIQSIK